jgi:prepilin-type N-terminal cleavage/methylation domain-containing protein
LFSQKLFSQHKNTGFSLPEILVVVAILGVLAAIAIPVSMNQQSKASDASIRSDLTNVAAVVEGQLLAWRGAPPEGALNICSGISGDYPPVNSPQNTCEEGQWRATRVSNNQVLSPPVEGKLSPGIFVQGRIASDGSYCLDGSSSRSGAKNFYFDSQSSQVQEGTCKSIDWTPRGSLVGSTGATTTPGDLPPPPSGVAVEVLEGGSTATVKWNAQAGVTYIVKVSNEPAKTLTASTTGVVSCVFPAETCEGPATGNLMVGTYTAIVRAGNSEGWGAGATQDFKIENAAGGVGSLSRVPPPSQPTVSQTGADINLNWTAPTGLPDGEEIINYRISWSKDGVKWVGVVETGSNDTGFKIPGASFESGETYFFRIQAMSDSGILGRPSQVSTVLNYVVTKPAPPDLLFASPGLNKVDLTWTGSSTNTYLVERMPMAGIVGNVNCTSASTSNCSVSITSLANGTPYVFSVRTQNSEGVLSDTSTITGTPTNAVPPPAPMNLISTAGPAGGQATLTWKPPLNDGGAPIVQYQVQWSTNGTDWDDTNSVVLEERNISFDPANSVYTYIRGGLIASTQYHFRISAANMQGFGGTSSAQTAIPPTLAPVVSVAERDTNVLLTWPRVTGDTNGYVIYRNGTQIGTTASNVLSFRNIGLSNNTSYQYTVRARNSQNLLGDTSTSVTGIPRKIGTGGAETFLTSSGAVTTNINQYYYRVHRYTGVGNSTFSIGNIGRNVSIEYLIVAGGGGAGGVINTATMGGDAGQIRTGNVSLGQGNYTVTVGHAGAGGSGWGSGGSSGGNSVFHNITSTGGRGSPSRYCCGGQSSGGTGGNGRNYAGTVVSGLNANSATFNSSINGINTAYGRSQGHWSLDTTPPNQAANNGFGGWGVWSHANRRGGNGGSGIVIVRYIMH